MFVMALKSGLPLISAYTTDTVNVQMVIKELLGEEVLPAPEKLSQLTAHVSCRVFWTTKAVACDEATYTNLIKHEKCLVVINHPDPGPLAFSVGVVPTPKHLVTAFLEEVVPEDEVQALASCFSGLTLKDLGEIARLTMTRDGSLTPRGVLSTRAMLASKTQGVQQIDTKLDVYVPYQPLEEWVALNGPYFINPPDPRLTPRGILLNGHPGVGKSQAAKYIANEWNIPAYRLDMTSTLGRYVGESESNFQRILNIMDQESPSVLLLDEVEKLFSQATSDQNVTSRLLSQLLWWLQEHTSRVFVVMTTNDIEAIPQELYRGRRIDKTFTIQKLDLSEGCLLGTSILKSFKSTITASEAKMLKKAVNDYVSSQSDARISHAQVTQLVYDLIKKHKFWETKI